jgi:hypothetical protein
MAKNSHFLLVLILSLFSTTSTLASDGKQKTTTANIPSFIADLIFYKFPHCTIFFSYHENLLNDGRLINQVIEKIRVKVPFNIFNYYNSTSFIRHEVNRKNLACQLSLVMVNNRDEFKEGQFLDGVRR